jgi:hypothetical protein
MPKQMHGSLALPSVTAIIPFSWRVRQTSRSLNDHFHFCKRLCGDDILTERVHVGMPDSRLECSHDIAKPSKK